MPNSNAKNIILIFTSIKLIDILKINLRRLGLKIARRLRLSIEHFYFPPCTRLYYYERAVSWCTWIITDFDPTSREQMATTKARYLSNENQGKPRVGSCRTGFVRQHHRPWSVTNWNSYADDCSTIRQTRKRHANYLITIGVKRNVSIINNDLDGGRDSGRQVCLFKDRNYFL